MEGFEPAGSNDADTKDGPDHNDSAATGETENAPKKVDPAAMRKARAQKLEILRLRYFQRNDIPVDAWNEVETLFPLSKRRVRCQISSFLFGSKLTLIVKTYNQSM